MIGRASGSCYLLVGAFDSEHQQLALVPDNIATISVQQEARHLHQLRQFRS